jgi:hypothetical protein
MERLHEAINNPKDGVDTHVKHLFDNNNSKSLFKVTGLDLSHMMFGREDTSGIQIKNPLT